MSTRKHRDSRAPNAGHVAALAVALGVVGGVTNRLAPREVVGGCVAIVVGAVAALWLRRESRQPEDDEPERRPECRHESCHHNHPELPEHGEREQP